MVVIGGGVEDTRLEAKYRKHIRGQGQPFRGQTLLRPRTTLPRTDPLEAKDRFAQGQSQGPRTQAQVFSKKRSSKMFSRRSPKEEKEKRLRKFSARFLVFFSKILTIQKIVLSSSRGQGNFRGLEASRPRPRT